MQELMETTEWYKDVTFKDAKIFIKSNITSAARSFIAIGFYLKCVRDKEMYLEDGHANIWDFAQAEYGISKSTASRYMTMNDRFSKDGNSPIIADGYKEFGKSQLQEMLSLSDEQLEQVKPTDRVEDIRGIRKPKEIPYVHIPGQMEITDFPGIEPEDVAAAAKDREMVLADQPKGQTYTISAEDLLSEQPIVAVSQQPEQDIEYELRKKYCDAAARKLIESKYEWFAEDYINRVLKVDESEKQLKEQLAGKDTWYFADPLGNGIAHVNLLQEYIQFYDGSSWVGDCKWFYLCAAIQSMWNVIAIENAEAGLREQEEGSQLCKEESQPEQEPDQPNNITDVEFVEIEPAIYDKDIMIELITREERMFSEMGETWKKKQQYFYTKHAMMLDAYRMLQAVHEGKIEEETVWIK